MSGRLYQYLRLRHSAQYGRRRKSVRLKSQVSYPKFPNLKARSFCLPSPGNNNKKLPPEARQQVSTLKVTTDRNTPATSEKRPHPQHAESDRNTPATSEKRPHPQRAESDRNTPATSEKRPHPQVSTASILCRYKCRQTEPLIKSPGYHYLH